MTGKHRDNVRVYLIDIGGGIYLCELFVQFGEEASRVYQRSLTRPEFVSRHIYRGQFRLFPVGPARRFSRCIDSDLRERKD